MKKVVYVLIIILLTNTFVFAENIYDTEYNLEEQYKLGNEIAAIENLERLDIVRDVQTRWDETSLITRRDALKIAYVFNTSSRDFISWVNSYSSERLKSELEEISWSNGMNGYYGKFRTARKLIAFIQSSR